MESNSSLNFIVWTDCIKAGTSIAQKLTLSSNPLSEVNSLTGTNQGVSVNVFLRGPQVANVANPSNNVADGLIVSIESASETASDYLKQKKNVPLKVVVSSSDLKAFADERGATFVDKIDESFASNLVKSGVTNDDLIKQAFSKIDKDHNSVLTKDELIIVSKELNHSISGEEANDIISTLSKTGSINFDQFKQWWHLGRANFSQFRQVVQLEMQVEKLVKKGSSYVGDYIDKLQISVNDETTSSPDSLKSHISIKPKKDFDNGINFGLSVAAGTEGKAIIDSLPDYFSSNPLSASIELGIDDAEKGQIVVQSLEQAKEMIFQMIPGIQEKLEMGIDIKFRHVGTSVFIDVTIGGPLGEMVKAQYSQFGSKIGNLATSFKGYGSSHIVSGLKLNNALDISLEQIIEDASKFKIETTGETSNIKKMLAIATTIIQATNAYGNKTKAISSIFGYFGVFRLLEVKSEYDSDELFSLIKESISTFTALESQEEQGEVALQVYGGALSNYQQVGKAQLEGVKAMLGVFLEPFMETLKVLNFDRISISIVPSMISIFYKVQIGLVGITEFIRTNLLA
jgi:hypothetical protein